MDWTLSIQFQEIYPGQNWEESKGGAKERKPLPNGRSEKQRQSPKSLVTWVIAARLGVSTVFRSRLQDNAANHLNKDTKKGSPTLCLINKYVQMEA